VYYGAFLMPVQHGRDFRLEFLAQLFFAGREGPGAVTSLISHQRVACSAWIAQLQQEISAVDPIRRYDHLVLQFRLSQLEAIQTWLDQYEETLIAESAAT
jgi:PadR family transcriptional regulator, regulatory protein AphA